MTKMTQWMLGGLAVLAVSAVVYVMPARAAENGFSMMGMMGGRSHGMMQAAGGDMAEMHNVMMPLMSEMPAMHTQVMGEVATLLGMTTADLEAAMAQGKSLNDLAAEKNVAIGEVRAVMTRNMLTFLDKQVEEKRITQDQAGRMLGMMEKNMDACLSGQMGDMMKGMMGGMMSGNMGGMMNGMMGNMMEHHTKMMGGTGR